LSIFTFLLLALIMSFWPAPSPSRYISYLPSDYLKWSDLKTSFDLCVRYTSFFSSHNNRLVINLFFFIFSISFCSRRKFHSWLRHS
jgi:hypothetical protein